MQPRRDALESLVRQVRVLERGAERPERPPLATGWPGVDRLLGQGAGGEVGGGLARGAVHEWLGLDTPRLAHGAGAESTRGGKVGWTPPLFLLAHLAWRALTAQGELEASGARDERWVLWIGRRVWPYPRTLTREGGLLECAAKCVDATRSTAPLEGARFELELGDAPRARPGGATSARALLDRSLFIDPPDRKGLLWAVDAALRCPSVAAVVADGSNLTMPASRRLQLAAEAGSGLCLLAKPPDEIRQLSAAATRWRVRRGGPVSAAVSTRDEDPDDLTTDPLDPNDRPRWELELVRCKAGFARVTVGIDGACVRARPGISRRGPDRAPEMRPATPRGHRPVGTSARNGSLGS
ncbi:ImuA family protein [Engelhardtia mirabilis]|uniref:Uncharacterized protein n=1 Tax=Engelhardtia mirabilis TaxID=2528011 RepID=A0A518BFW8_9BACT|nr:hypothetical protein Pla133_09450 [Planctomycetes bacterium Pla133]QDV00205.1 hypothetical protein Pla86_09440 [Planctomycetes bacterium Pla86]